MQGLAHQTIAKSAPPLQRIAMAGTWRVELLPREPYSASFVADRPTLGFAFDVQTGVHRFASDRRMDFRAKPNSLAYVPAGCDVFSESQHGGEYLQITLAHAQSKTFKTARHFSDAIDGIAITTAQELRRLLLAGKRIDALHMEHLVHLLRERALVALGKTTVAVKNGSCMTVRRLRLIDELIDSRLDDQLTVQDLAQALGLSTGFFSRALKAAIGKSPYNYIVDCRISHARTLLQATHTSLTEIAYASGFSSHAHMTALFRQRLCVTPTQLRSAG